MNRLTIYMKSGNVIKLRGIKKWTVQCQGNTVTRLELERYSWAFLLFGRLLMTSLDLSQIEAITESGLLT